MQPGTDSLAVRAAVVTFDVISTTTANGSGPAQRTAGHATSVLAAARCPYAFASGFGPARAAASGGLSAHSLLKERHTMAATVAETIPYALVVTDWNDERRPKARARDDGFAGGLADVINTVMSNWRLLA